MGLGPNWSTGNTGSARPPVPNPANFNITIIDEVGSHVVAWINYPDCTNFEGNKILVFENISQEQVLNAEKIDPHFYQDDSMSPIARFEPTEKGWHRAMLFVATL